MWNQRAALAKVSLMNTLKGLELHVLVSNSSGKSSQDSKHLGQHQQA